MNVKSQPVGRICSRWSLGVVALAMMPVTASAETRSLGENLVKNQSFENKAALAETWIKRLGAKLPGEEQVTSTAALDEKVAQDGSNSLRLSGDIKTTRWIAIESAAVPVEPDAYYQLVGWMKTEDVKAEGRQYLNANYYVQFADENNQLVKVGPSPVVTTDPIIGTHKWTKVEALIRAPLGSHHCRVGCALTCSGTAWFDTVSLRRRLDIEWKTIETDRFIYHYEEGTTPPTADMLEDNRKYLERVEEILGISYPDKIRYFRYESSKRAEELFSDSIREHLDSSEIHDTTWRNTHQVIHVVMRPLGVTNSLLAEGIVSYLSSTLHGANVHIFLRVARRTGAIPHIEELVNPTDYKRFHPGAAYNQAGSFVGFLVEAYGIENFLKVYGYETSDDAVVEFPARFRSVYGKDLATVEEEWREFVMQFPENRQAIVPPETKKNK